MQYEVDIFGCHFKGGKFMPKEAEEGSAPADNATSAKPASKPTGKPSSKPEEPKELSEEEKKKLEEEAAEMEARNSQLKANWESMSLEDQFY